MAVLAAIGPTRASLPGAVVLYSLAFGALLVLLRNGGEGLNRAGVLLGGTLLLRLLFLPTLPDLSDDLYRYVWDGLLSAHGVNPFRFLPGDPALTGVADPALLAAMNSAEYFSVYPPLSQLIFLLGGVAHGALGWPASALAVKLGFAAMEFAGVVFLFHALRRMEVPASRLALYAWNPLVVVTLAGGGHTEGALVLGMGMMLWGLSASRAAPAWTGWALAVCSKAIPLLFAPLLFRHLRGRIGTRRTAGGLAVGAGVVAALTLPFYFPGLVSRFTSSVDLYVRLFEFNAGPYFAVKWALLQLTGDDWSKVLGPAFRLLFLMAAVALWLRWRVNTRTRTAEGLLLLLSLYLLFATTVHPWYLVWGLVLVPFTPRLRAVWLWASWAAFPTYLTYIGVSHSALAALFWTGVGVALLVEWRDPLFHALLRLAGRRKAHQIRPHLQGTRLLDLGGGEGYVGAALLEGDRRVVVAEVDRYRGPALPRVHFDGRRLPFPDSAFHSVVLSLVLHHAKDPDQLVREALRVTSGPVIVTESLYRWAWERRLLEWLDRAANRGRGSGKMARDPEPIRFRTAEAWEGCFAGAGARLARSERLNRVGHRHHLFVLEREQAT